MTLMRFDGVAMSLLVPSEFYPYDFSRGVHRYLAEDVLNPPGSCLVDDLVNLKGSGEHGRFVFMCVWFLFHSL